MTTDIQNLRNSKDPKDRHECISLLKNHLNENPNNTEAWFDLASCHDFLGEEPLAEAAYKKAYELSFTNLPTEKQPSLFVQYGSTLRNNKKFDESKKILLEGCERFAEHKAMKVFLAFTLFNLNEHQEASRLLFTACKDLPTPALEGFERAIKYYVENLDTYP